MLLGPPASGKGTQADFLKSRFALPVASPGAMLREEKMAGTELGLAADRLTSQGRLLSDDTINSVVKAWVSRQQGDGFVFDGYPRTLGQGDALDQLLASCSMPLEVVFLLEVETATLRSRVEHRMICLTCGATVSTGLHVSPDETKCPKCSGQLGRRGDDTLETLQARLIEYNEKTAPLIGRYEQSGLLVRIPAEETPEQVFAHICEKLDV